MKMLFWACAVFLLNGCGNPKIPFRGEDSPPAPGRGRLIEFMKIKGVFTGLPNQERLDFGGASLFRLTTPIRIDEGDLSVLSEVFWESGRGLEISLPEARKCVPSLFGIDPKRSASGNDFVLKFWGWDNVGVTTDCEDFTHAVPIKGLQMKLKQVRYADVGLIANLEVSLTAH